MYDLRNLNDYEFEYLALDVMTRKLDTELYRFPKGRDEGIDLCDEIVQPKIIVQVKHIKNASQLKSKINNEELKKVEKIKPENYYLFTSCELTRNKKVEIYNILKPYMKSADNIISGIEINDFLEKEENQDIVKKHYKLWLAASNVMSLINNNKIFIDCDELVYDIEKQSKFFVETEGYLEALEKLQKENTIIIVGAPGVGKSTISKMIILKYVSDGYKVRYTSDNNIGDIKNVLSNNKDEKEIILLDDFLGQHYLNLKETEPNELKSLCAFIRRNPNKKLIMNSRITILSEARSRFLNFDEFMEEYDENKYLIDLDEMKDIEKAKILYNHIYFNNLPEEHFKELQKKQRYLQIIRHRNYNPRIIEYVTKNRKEKDPEEYYKYIMDNLENPKNVWKDEFENRLEASDRKFMFTLYSLTNRYVDINIFNKAYGKYISKDSLIDKSINIFERVTKRLSDSLINKIPKEQNIEVGAINPSVNDYMKSELDSNINQVMEIVENAVYIEQILKFKEYEPVKNLINDKILSGEFLKYKTFESSIFFYYIEYIFENNIQDEKIKQSVKLAFERSYEQTIKLHYNKMLLGILRYQGELLKFYDIYEILYDCNKMQFIYQNMYYDTIKAYLEAIIEIYEPETKYEVLYQDVLEDLKEYLIEEMRENIASQVDNNLYELASDIVDNAREDDIEEFEKNKCGKLLDDMDIKAYEEISKVANELIDEMSEFICIDEDELELEDIETTLNLEEYLESSIDYLEDEDAFFSYKGESMDDLSEIHAMFKR